MRKYCINALRQSLFNIQTISPSVTRLCYAQLRLTLPSAIAVSRMRVRLQFLFRTFFFVFLFRFTESFADAAAEQSFKMLRTSTKHDALTASTVRTSTESTTHDTPQMHILMACVEKSERKYSHLYGLNGMSTTASHPASPQIII